MSAMANTINDNNYVKKNITQNELIKNVIYQKQLAWALAPITTLNTLERISDKNSPLDLLSPAAKERFIESVVFRKGGLGGFYYGDLEAELTPTQIHKILSMFGAQHAVGQFNNARIETQADVLLLSNPVSLLKNQINSINGHQKLGTSTIPPSAMAFFAEDQKGKACSSAKCITQDEYICMSSC